MSAAQVGFAVRIGQAWGSGENSRLSEHTCADMTRSNGGGSIAFFDILF